MSNSIGLSSKWNPRSGNQEADMPAKMGDIAPDGFVGNLTP